VGGLNVGLVNVRFRGERRRNGDDKEEEG